MLPISNTYCFSHFSEAALNYHFVLPPPCLHLSDRSRPTKVSVPHTLQYTSNVLVRTGWTRCSRSSLWQVIESKRCRYFAKRARYFPAQRPDLRDFLFKIAPVENFSSSCVSRAVDAIASFQRSKLRLCIGQDQFCLRI